MLENKIFVFLSFLLLFCTSSVFSNEKTKTIVTVVEGKVMCFDLPSEITYPGELKTGTFIDRISDYIGKVEITSGKKVTAYIPYNQRYYIYDKLQEGVSKVSWLNWIRI